MGGRARANIPGAGAFKSVRALTLVEILISIAIIVILTAFLVPQVSVLRRKAYISNTEALIKKVDTALKLYYDQFRDYPPDGYDPEPGYNVTGDGVQLGNGWPTGGPRRFKGTGCLIYFLSLPVTKVTVKGPVYGNTVPERNLRREVVGPFLTEVKSSSYSITDFQPRDLRRDATVANVELIDAFGRPLCYDKVRTRENTSFQPNLFDGVPFGSGRPHHIATRDITSVEEEPGVDPNNTMSPAGINEDLNQVWDPRRTQRDAAGFLNTGSPAGPQNVGHFDLWSRGALWTDPNDDICSWLIN